MIARVLEMMGATVRARVEMYKAVAQSVLLYGSKIVVVTREMLKVSMVFHNRAAQRITGMPEKCGIGREWEYQAVEEAMDAEGLHPIGLYIKRRQTTIVDRVACHPIYELCTKAERMPGTIQMVHCWYQDAVNELEE